MSLMCQTCSTIKFEELVKNVCFASQKEGISSEKADKLDTFVKKTALEGTNDQNKRELMSILNENSPEKLSLFITKYVKDFPQKFHEFVFSEILE